ncbi:hypothetical protein [Legionella israelensis]|uniref:Uncharacterized protein n=1 Tax=Legionella israelensis TaxID=454 RepID=A0A0W0VPG5_9GAMM|nr:hypothetical protein [Legionella israelensis]KTD21998.1 hypothetical protein Lisr_1523 [Legionella israelensis]QBS08737.1 hypothetical protein E4T55_02010 [Legionella israelensis]SCY55146.1 hypothetical protein SAMN02746069_02834 [Legionella israelensis DSM 19235]STX58411.1 Uncharacterised protein [Legionella israelensis]
MSRIRTIKPEFWSSEQVVSCSPSARLLFIGLWNFCDDNGVHQASFVRLKAEVFPCDDFTTKDIELMVHELIQKRLLYEYKVDDTRYWIVTGWRKHQRIDKPTKKHPLPDKFDDNSNSAIGLVCNSSQISCESFDESSTTEWKGMEGKGKDKYICEVKTSPEDLSEPYSIATKEVFEYWKTIMNHPRAKLDNKRKRVITNALKLGYSLFDLKKAIDGCANTSYNMGKNENNQVYDDIGLILRDADHIERFINNACQEDGESKSVSNSQSLMAGVL